VLSLILFLLGLMSKPMLVTLPFLLLLLDFWPLRRLGWSQSGNHTVTIARLVFEKLPFFGLAAASSVVTYLVQQHGGAIYSNAASPLGPRIANALVSYASYVLKTVWPSHLAVFYPYQAALPTATVVLAGCLLLAATIGVVMAVRKYPWLFVGWFWFTGTLVPVIGLVQAGSQAMADRYTYIPMIGLLIALAWSIPSSWMRRPSGVAAVTAGVAVCVILCGTITWQQLGHWKSTATLFRHALEATSHNYVAHERLGSILADEGKTEAARMEFERALELKPDLVPALYNLAKAHLQQGNPE
jgi:Mg2+/Co2+ transporter CorB